MLAVLAEIKWGDIAQVLWAAPIAGIGVTVLFSLGLYGSTKAAEASREKRGGGAALFGVLAVLGFLAFACGIVFGVGVIVNK